MSEKLKAAGVTFSLVKSGKALWRSEYSSWVCVDFYFCFSLSRSTGVGPGPRARQARALPRGVIFYFPSCGVDASLAGDALKAQKGDLSKARDPWSMVCFLLGRLTARHPPRKTATFPGPPPSLPAELSALFSCLGHRLRRSWCSQCSLSLSRPRGPHLASLDPPWSHGWTSGRPGAPQGCFWNLYCVLM